MEPVKKAIKPRGHLIADRHLELFFGFLLFFAGAVLLWDAWGGRGKKAPWPLSTFLPS